MRSVSSFLSPVSEMKGKTGAGEFLIRLCGVGRTQILSFSVKGGEDFLNSVLATTFFWLQVLQLVKDLPESVFVLQNNPKL